MGNDVKVISKIDRTICGLYYLSRVYNINFNALLTLYEKYDKDVFYFFYLFCNRRLVFPSEEKLIEIFNQADLVCSKLKGKNIDLKNDKVKSVYEYLSSCVVDDEFEFNITDSNTKISDLVDGINVEIV